MNPIYIKSYIDPVPLLNEVINVPWEQRISVRQEYFMADQNVTYIYSNRAYDGKQFTPLVYDLMEKINDEYKFNYNVCFLNRYNTQHDALGWHSDVADTVSVISLGADREIWWKHKNEKGKIPENQKQLLENGSLFIMPSGFQNLYLHKIPKHNRPCYMRISLTFRKLP
jgi:alkylated DNA repair dioxygenase AlkB